MPRSRFPSFFNPRAFGDSVRPSISASAARVAARAAVPAPRALPVAPVPAPAAVPAPVPAAYVAPIPAPAPVATSANADVKARLRTILNSSEADGRETLARQLALETDLPAAEAIARLAASPRGPSPVVASGLAGAAIARQALGLPADPQADRAVAEGVAAALGGPIGADAAASSSRWSSDFEEGARTARELLGRA